MKESLGKIFSDYIGLTEALGGQVNGTVKIRTEVDKDEFKKLEAEIKSLDGDEVRIRAIIDKSSLKDIDGLADYAVNRAKEGKSISIDGVNELINAQNFNNIASQAHGFFGVNKAISEYNNLVKEGSVDTGKLVATISNSNSKLGEYLGTLKDTNGQYVKANSRLAGYAGHLVKATAKTIGLELATNKSFLI